MPISDDIREHLSVTAALEPLSEQISEATKTILSCLQAGGKLVAFGNGGSAADAQHFAAELVGRYRADRQAIAAVALTTDTSALTAIANDYGFHEVFARQLEAIGRPQDVVVAFSTSGNSPNILRALEYARELGLPRIGLTGKEGGKMRGLVDICLCVPSNSIARIQEAHILLVHILAGMIENVFACSSARLTVPFTVA
jgi:D-sedoheptulose 7-phosphate isomerase